MPKRRILKDFLCVKKIAGINVKTLKEILQEKQSQSGNVVIDGRTLGCVSVRYKLKCKSTNCHLIQCEINQSTIGHQNCHRCHLAFLNEYENGNIQAKK